MLDSIIGRFSRETTYPYNRYPNEKKSFVDKSVQKLAFNSIIEGNFPKENVVRQMAVKRVNKTLCIILSILIAVVVISYYFVISCEMKLNDLSRQTIVLNNERLYIRLLKEEVPSYDVDGLLDWIKRNGAIEVAYQMATPQIIHMQPNMTPYVSTRPYQGSIESQGNILESSFLDYTGEQSIISPKPLGDGDVLRWEQGSQCYVYENDKEYIPLTNYNQPMGTVLDLEEEDGEQFVENLDGGDIIVDVPFKEKAVYERHLLPHEDNVIYKIN